MTEEAGKFDMTFSVSAGVVCGSSEFRRERLGVSGLKSDMLEPAAELATKKSGMVL
jgi:hypothetical protein